MSNDRKPYGPRVSYEEARPHILNLVAGGKARPSAKDLYDVMGRGSIATHQKHIDRFREEEQPRRAAELVMPPDAQEFYLLVLRKQLSEARRDFESELLELRQDKATLVEESERLQEELEASEARYLEASSQLQQKLGAMEQMNEEISRLRLEVERAKEEARREIDAVRLAADTAIAGIENRAKQDMAALRIDIDNFRQESEKSKLALVKADLRLEELPRLSAEKDRLQKAFDAERDNRHKAEQNRAVAEARCDELKAYRTEAEGLRDELKSLQEKRLALETAVATLTAERVAEKRANKP